MASQEEKYLRMRLVTLTRQKTTRYCRFLPCNEPCNEPVLSATKRTLRDCAACMASAIVRHVPPRPWRGVSISACRGVARLISTPQREGVGEA